jgi:hypothetical protein
MKTLLIVTLLMMYLTPSVQTSDLSIDPTDTSFDLITAPFCYTKGSGMFTVVIANPYHAVNVTPTDGAYLYDQGDTSYGSGYNLGDGNYVTYVGLYETQGMQICNVVVNLPKTGHVYLTAFEFDFDFETEEAEFLTSVSSSNTAHLSY